MLRTLQLLCLLLLIPAISYGQWQHLYQGNPVDLDVPFYQPNPVTTVYDPIHTLFGAMEPISYFNFVGGYDKKFINPSVDFYDPDFNTLQDSLEKTTLEINFYIPWTIWRGRGQSDDWIQAARITFDYWGQVRVANKSSSPILPPTNAFGFASDIAVWDNFREKFIFGARKLPKRENFDKRNFWEEHDKSTFKLVTAQVKLMHYSNGQAPGFFIPGDTINHDYLGGDFSTNYLQWMLGYHRAHQAGSILSIWGGYRVDFELIPGLFKFADEQKNSYGQQRLLLNLQWITKARSFRERCPLKDLYNKNGDGGKNSELKKYSLKDLWNLQLRTEMVYIIDNVDDWRKVGAKGDKYRLGIKQFAKFNFLRNRNLGLTAMYYYGRDYLNIRFDNVVSIWSVGLNFKFNKNPIIAAPKTYTPLNF